VAMPWLLSSITFVFVQKILVFQTVMKICCNVVYLQLQRKVPFNINVNILYITKKVMSGKYLFVDVRVFRYVTV